VSATDRQAVTVDALGWRDHRDMLAGVYTGNIALALEAAGGGIVLADGAEVPAVTPADGIGCRRSSEPSAGSTWLRTFMGSYTSTAQGLSWSGDIFDANRSSIDPTALIPTPTAHAEVPTGAQPNGRSLYSALEGPYVASINSSELPGAITHLPGEHGPAAGASPDAVAGGVTITAEQIIFIEPALQGSRTPGGTATYVVTVRNVRTTDATFTLTLQGLPSGFVGKSPIQ